MYSLTKLIQSLISLGNDNARNQELGLEIEDGRKEITSIRLRPQTRAYLQAQSDALGISVSQVINLIIDGVVEIESQPQKNKIDSIYDRLITLFESHKITPLDMSRILKNYGVTLSKLKSKDAILDLITPEMIEDVSSIFGVKSKWLNGEDDYIYNPRDITWYKNAEGMAITILARRIIYGRVNVFVVKREGVEFKVAEERDDNENCLDVGFILCYEKNVDGVKFEQYEVCEFQRWNYINCRNQLKLIFKFLDDLNNKVSGVSFNGISLNDNLIEKLYLGKILPVQIRNIFFNKSVWYPEELTSDIDSAYRNKKFSKFIEAYCEGPIKSFEYTPTSLDGRIWSVSIFNAGNEEKQGFSSLGDALLKIHSDYQKN